MSMKACNARFLKFVLKELISGNQTDYRSLHNLTDCSLNVIVTKEIYRKIHFLLVKKDVYEWYESVEEFFHNSFME